MDKIIYSPNRENFGKLARKASRVTRTNRETIDDCRVSSETIDTLVVSDVHLGSNVSRVQELFSLLKSFAIADHKYRLRRLVLLGDMFDDMNFRRLRKYEWKLLGLIREMTDEESNVEVVWLRGNHDIELIELMEHLVGTNVHEEYHWQVAGKRFFAMHGDQFDKWVIDYPILIDIPLFIYEMIQKIDGSRHTISRFLKDKSKKWLRINEEVARGIMGYAHKKGYNLDAIFCGHTHLAEEAKIGDLMYYNTGCWTGTEAPTYITISLDGAVQLLKFENN
jgi:UDP-2,3-diacylglucosamine pyrophosphatase LpxH